MDVEEDEEEVKVDDYMEEVEVEVVVEICNLI